VTRLLNERLGDFVALAAHDDPQSLAIGAQVAVGHALMTAKNLQGLVERQQVAADHLAIEAPRGHCPNSPRRIRARWAASIFASCGAKSQ
jgi:hypothetical protein